MIRRIFNAVCGIFNHKPVSINTETVSTLKSEPDLKKDYGVRVINKRRHSSTRGAFGGKSYYARTGLTRV